MAFKDLTRRIYDHTLNLASRKNALTWLFVISFIESSFFPIPPDIMIIPMVWLRPKKHTKLPALQPLPVSSAAISAISSAFTDSN